jgi:NAD(P)-dependent dehydrogenase (short-subunit alcohol dehydrogenase family)
MTNIERLRPRHSARTCGGGVGAVLIGAGDAAVAGRAARRFAAGGAQVVVLHRPADEAAALCIARQVEAEGRRCELLAGDLDDGELCEEGAIHAAFLGRGGIGAVVCVGAPLPSAPDEADAALRRASAEFRSLLHAALPHLVNGARVLHLWPAPPVEPEGGAPAARREALRLARGVLGVLGRSPAIEKRCGLVDAGPTGWGGPRFQGADPSGPTAR